MNVSEKPFEAIILAGGLGTRLRSEVADLPKCMAPVAGKPFLHFLISHLLEQGTGRFVFSLGYKHEAVESYLHEAWPELDFSIVVEKEPLGTGGAVVLAARETQNEQIFVANGDTMFLASLAAIYEAHIAANAECTLALKPMRDFDRYGAVSLGPTGTILSFHEKKQYAEGLINAGLYLLDKTRFLSRTFPGKFSFENAYLESYAAQGILQGTPLDEYFIDIGIPVDFHRAQEECFNWPGFTAER